jgi:hypothetical protein
MKLKSLLVASALAAAPILSTTSASYADIEYVVDATFGDSTSVTGYFILNVYGYPDNWDLTTTTGTTVTGYTYTPSTSLSGGTGCSHCVGFPRMNPFDYDGALQLEFTGPISGYGPQTLSVGKGGPSWESSNFPNTDDTPNLPVRYIISGTVTGVPEPATWALMLIGFVGLGIAGYRLRRIAAVSQ